MKALILSTKVPYPPRDGGAIATLNLAMGLAEKGITVTMLTFNTLKHHMPVDKIPSEIKTKIRFVDVEKDTSPTPVQALTNLIFSKRPYIAERFSDEQFKKRLIDLLQDEKPDVVQVEGPYLAEYLQVIRQHSKALVAFRAHNAEHTIWSQRSENARSPWQKWYFRNLSKRIEKLEMKLAQEADLLVAISDHDLDILSKGDPGKSITIPAGIKVNDYPLVDQEQNSDPCFIGALDWGPNIEGIHWLVNEVMPRLKEMDSGINLHVAGRNASTETGRLIATAGLNFYGEVEDARSFMKNHNILLVPLSSGSGIRVKILEGMAMGMCIITTSIGASGLPVENNRHLLIEDNPEQFARAIYQLHGNPGMRKEISDNARKLVAENFDTFAVASRLGDFYTKLA